MPPAPARIPRRARGAGTRALTAPLHAPHGAAGGRSPKPSTATPDCERDAHAGWVRGVGAIRGGRPRARGAHVKRGAHGPAVYCVGSFYSSPETCGISGLAEARAELRAHRGPRAARRPSPAAPSARTRSPGRSPRGVDHTRASPHHVAHIPAHPAPLSLGHQQELLDASVNEAEARSSRCWDREPATCRVWAPSVACDQHLTLWRAQRRTLTAAARGRAESACPPRRRQPGDGGGQASEPHRAPPTRPVARRRPRAPGRPPRHKVSPLTLNLLLFQAQRGRPSAAAAARAEQGVEERARATSLHAPHLTATAPPGPRGGLEAARG